MDPLEVLYHYLSAPIIMDHLRSQHFDNEDQLFSNIVNNLKSSPNPIVNSFNSSPNTQFYYTRLLFAKRIADRSPDEHFSCLDDVAAALAADKLEALLPKLNSFNEVLLEYWLEETEEKLLCDFFDVSLPERERRSRKAIEEILSDPTSNKVIWVAKSSAPCKECQKRDQRVFSIDDPEAVCPLHYDCHCDLMNAARYAGYISGVGRFQQGNFEVFLDGIQFILDLAGLIPGVGEIFDGINAVIYIARGDYVNAALSTAAMIPVAGWAATGAKFVGKVAKVIKVADKAADAAKIAEKVIPKAEEIAKLAKDLDRAATVSEAVGKAARAGEKATEAIAIAEAGLTKEAKIFDALEQPLSHTDDILDASPASKFLKAPPVEGTFKTDWLKSENKVLKMYSGFKPKVSFKNGVEVPYGIKGSVCPDGYMNGYSLEVKRYNLSTQSNVRNLINVVSTQINQRVIHLPPGTKQIIAIDIEDQLYDDFLTHYIEDMIMIKTNFEPVLIKYIY